MFKNKLKLDKFLQSKTYNIRRTGQENSLLRNYLIGARRQYNIINYEKIVVQWFKIKKLIENIILKNNKILIVHTNSTFKDVLGRLANKTTQVYYNHWYSGLLTNYNHTRWVYKKVNKLFFSKKPALIVLIDYNVNLQIVNEARIKNIPIIGFLSDQPANGSPDYPILTTVSKSPAVYFYYNLFLRLFKSFSFTKLKTLNTFKNYGLRQLIKKKKKLLRKKKIKIRRKNWFKQKRINFLKSKQKYQKNYNAKKQFFKKTNNPKI